MGSPAGVYPRDAALFGAARISRAQPGGPGDGTPDEAWRGGGFLYVNRADPALFVPKRLGVGYTMNFGRPAAWAVLALFIALPIAVALTLAIANR